MRVDWGDWIIRGVNGGLYPCKPDIFEKMYQPADGPGLVDEVKTLLGLMGQLDPNCQEQRHPEWPMQLRGDEDATSALCACLNRLQELTKS